MSFFSELRRRGVLGAITAYGVVAAGGLQLADIVVHGMDLPPWTMRALIWVAALGLIATGVISWFFDLTSRGFVRTEAPVSPPRPISPGPVTPASATAPPAAALEPGASLANGRYRIEKELGKGGMGRVLAATDTRLGRRVAIKVVTGAHEPERIRRFEQEARTAGSLEHPNVLAVYDLGEQDGVPFLVTELLEGHTLRTVLSGGPLPPDQAQNLALQLAHGLAAAHARGVVHRDLKPENLFVTNDGRLKILDFGLAKLVTPAEGDSLTQTGAVFGTPGYLSPEQARGERAGPPSDVFSAGAVLYEMISGKRAFPGRTLVEAGHAALTLQPEPLPQSSLTAPVMRSLEKEPSRRFADGGELARALEPGGQGATVAPVPRARRSRGARVRIVALALGVAFASLLWARRQSGAARKKAESSARRVQLLPQPPQPPESPVIPAPPGFDQRALEEQLRKIVPGMRYSGTNTGVLAGARAVASAGQIGRAEELLRRQLKRNPADMRTHMELAALLRRGGRKKDAEKDLAAFAGALDEDDWPAPVVRVWAGLEREDAAIEAAREDDDEAVTRSRLCEAYYYLGLMHATAGDRDQARTLFQKAIEQRTSDIESSFAVEELRALEGR